MPNPVGLVANELAGRIDEMLSGRIAEGLAGAVLVKHRGRIILQRGYGMADRARGSDGISMFAYRNGPDLELEVLIGTSTPMLPATRLAQRIAGLVR